MEGSDEAYIGDLWVKKYAIGTEEKPDVGADHQGFHNWEFNDHYATTYCRMSSITSVPARLQKTCGLALQLFLSRRHTSHYMPTSTIWSP
jgi:hypothetical protein